MRVRARLRVLGLSLLLIPALVIGSAAMAVAEPRRPPPNTKKVQVLREKAFKRLTAAQEALTAGNRAEAMAILDDMKSSTRFNDHERAKMFQSYAFVYNDQEDYARAIEAFEASVATQGLSLVEEMSTRYNIAQLYLVSEQYQRGIQALNEWLELAESPPASAYILLSNAYAQLGSMKQAIPPVETALSMTQSPQEGWLRLAAALYLDQERYGDAVGIFEQLVRRFSKKGYWMQLVAVYGTLERERDSLTALEVAHRQGFLTKSSELVRLAQLYLYHDIPYRCALVLDRGLEDETIEKTRKNWELLSDCWYRAQELDRSLGPMKKAARLSDDGELWMRLGQIRVEAEDWKESIRALEQAIHKGKLRRAGQAHLLLGIARFNSGELDAAEKSFQRALKHEKTKRSARQWLNHLRQTLR